MENYTINRQVVRDVPATGLNTMNRRKKLQTADPVRMCRRREKENRRSDFKKMCYVDNIAKDDTSVIFLSLRRNNLGGGL